MGIGIGSPIFDLASLPGASRPGGGGGDTTDTFPFKIQLDLTGQTFPYTFNIRYVSASNVTTDWGDGTSEVVNVAFNNLNHTYTDASITEPIITFGNKAEGNSLSVFRVNNTSGSKNELKDIIQWGEGTWSSNSNALQFYGASNLNASATDKPIVGASTLNSSFYKAFSMNPANINDWDVSNVTQLANTFYDAASFNQDLNKWDISNVITFGTLGFRGATVFNGNIDNWDVSGLIVGLGSMFMFCRNFNRDISTKSISAENSPTGIAYTAWDIGANPNITSLASMFYQQSSAYGDFNQDITNWDTSNITNMKQMFNNNKSFNQPIGVWDVSSVTNMQYMVAGALAFNQNCSAWNLSSSLTNVDRFGLSNSMSDDNWTDTLVGWAVSTYKNSGPYNVSSTTNNSVNFIDSKTSDTASGETYESKYGSDWTNTGWDDSTAARAYLVTETGDDGAGWNITGD